MRKRLRKKLWRSEFRQEREHKCDGCGETYTVYFSKSRTGKVVVEDNHACAGEVKKPGADYFLV